MNECYTNAFIRKNKSLSRSQPFLPNHREEGSRAVRYDVTYYNTWKTPYLLCSSLDFVSVGTGKLFA